MIVALGTEAGGLPGWVFLGLAGLFLAVLAAQSWLGRREAPDLIEDPEVAQELARPTTVGRILLSGGAASLLLVAFMWMVVDLVRS